MDLEERVTKLEHEMSVLKTDIQGTLSQVQDSLATESHSPSVMRWRQRAWVFSLVNVLLATVLFVNIRVYLPGEAGEVADPVLFGWLRALWVALAFVWLILQMYPLALLLEQEEDGLKGTSLRNALRLFKANPGFSILLTVIVLLVALASALIPQVWLVVLPFVVIAGVCVLIRRRSLSKSGRKRGV